MLCDTLLSQQGLWWSPGRSIPDVAHTEKMRVWGVLCGVLCACVGCVVDSAYGVCCMGCVVWAMWAFCLCVIELIDSCIILLSIYTYSV